MASRPKNGRRAESRTPAGLPTGPRLNNGTGPLIDGGMDFSGGGFFVGVWLSTGDGSGQTAPFSNAIFAAGWYTTTVKSSMRSGTSGVYVGCPTT